MGAENVKLPLEERVPGWTRVLLQLASAVLCLSLMGNLFGLMLTADLRQAMGRDGFRTLVDSAFTAYFQQLQTPRQSRAAQPLTASRQTASLDFSDPESLVDWAYGLVQKAVGNVTTVKKESVRNFLVASTVKDHLADKLATAVPSLLQTGSAGDLFAQGEIAALMEENQEVIAREFGASLTEERLQSIAGVIDATIQADGVNDQFRDYVERFTKGQTPILFGITAQDVFSFIATRLTGEVFWTQLITCLVLVVLLCLVNFYNVPAGLTWAAFPCILSGGMLALVTSLLALPEKFASMQPTLDALKGLIAPVHNTVLGIGAGLLVVSIAWRILRSAITKKVPATA